MIKSFIQRVPTLSRLISIRLYSAAAAAADLPANRPIDHPAIYGKKDRVVVALGGNALLRRGKPMNHESQINAAREACKKLAKVSKSFQLIISHGNGPQVGLLSLQHGAYSGSPPSPLDVLNAQTEGSIGYFLQQSMMNNLPGADIACLITQVVVNPDDPAWENPTKFVGPSYSKEEIEEKVKENPHWVVKADGKYLRRVVASPQPQFIAGLNSIKMLVENNQIVICCGGGGIPVRRKNSELHGKECVIDKDLCSALLARSIGADGLVLLTDGGGIIPYYGTPHQEREMKVASPNHIRKYPFPEGSMGPKVEACCDFVDRTGGWAAIGDLKDTEKLFRQEAGTFIIPDIEEIIWW